MEETRLYGKFALFERKVIFSQLTKKNIIMIKIICKCELFVIPLHRQKQLDINFLQFVESRLEQKRERPSRKPLRELGLIINHLNTGL